jgi:hypothetical protein
MNENELVNVDTLNTRRTKISTNALAVLFFIFYLILGLVFYCYSDSQLNALDALYFSVITFTTVGYGIVILDF